MKVNLNTKTSVKSENAVTVLVDGIMREQLTFRVAGSLKNVQRRISLTILAKYSVTASRAMTK